MSLYHSSEAKLERISISFVEKNRNNIYHKNLHKCCI